MAIAALVGCISSARNLARHDPAAEAAVAGDTVAAARVEAAADAGADE